MTPTPRGRSLAGPSWSQMIPTLPHFSPKHSPPWSQESHRSRLAALAPVDIGVLRTDLSLSQQGVSESRQGSPPRCLPKHPSQVLVQPQSPAGRSLILTAQPELPLVPQGHQPASLRTQAVAQKKKSGGNGYPMSGMDPPRTATNYFVQSQKRRTTH